MTSPTDPPRMRLSIADLMLWTLGSGIILACFRAIRSGDDDMPDRVRQLLPFYDLGYSLTLGAQVGSLLLFAVRRMRRQGGFPEQPGHWLLLIEGISALLSFAGYGLFGLFTSRDSHSIYVYFALQVPNLIACTIGYGCGFVNTVKDSPWRFALCTCAIVHGMQAMLFAFSAALWYLETRGGSWLGVWEMPQSCFGPALAIVILVVNILDRRNFRQRDIFHWAGVVAFVANVALLFVYRMIVIGI